MSDIHGLIQAAYPNATTPADYTVVDNLDGLGAYLETWHIAGPIPAGVLTMEEPTARWQRLSTEQVMRSATLVDSFATNQRLRPFVEAAIEATAEGEIVPGTAWTKEAAADVLRLWNVLGAFLSTPIREGGPTPLEVISRYA